MGQMIELGLVLVALIGFVWICRAVGRTSSIDEVMGIVGESISLKSGSDRSG